MSAISSRVRNYTAPWLPLARTQPRTRARTELVVDVALAIFAVAMTALMVARPGHEAAPFHFLFVALALAYGYRVWPVKPTLLVILTLSLPSGWLMVNHSSEGVLARAELAEIPLMPLVLLAMVWHAQRRARALRRVKEMADRQLTGMQREREFFRDASHAIRTPVTIARGHLELAAATSLPDEVQDDLAVALRQLDRMSALSNRLLALAHLDAGDAVRLQPTDLAALVTNLGQNWSASADRHWRVDCEPTGLLMVDPEWITLALDALLENAVHFTTDDDEIRMICRSTATTCTITVADSGPGIEPEDLPHVFDRFWHRMPPSGPMGSGLGLSMARSAAVAHGGSLTASNDRGAVFEVTLPVRRPADG
jgi:signal transduction histidine kinase